MLFDLPDRDELYRALLARDDRYDGRAFVGVTSTGVFCRLSCPARKPKPENCRFFDTAAACVAAGFRPCLRCHPVTAMIADDPVVTKLLTWLEERPGRRWSEADIENAGLDPSTVRRSFKRRFGITFLEMARQRRMQRAVEKLDGCGRVIDAQLDAGFSSPSAFREAFARLLGQSPGTLPKDAPLRAAWISTQLGPMIAIADARRLHLLEFVERRALAREVQNLRAATPGGIAIGRYAPIDRTEEELGRYFAGVDARFSVPLAPSRSPFATSVRAALRAIPPGETRSYGEIAAAIGRPEAVRAVARANGENQIAIIVPCHRVIGADGSLTGYGGGLWRKHRLIDIERTFRARSAMQPQETADEPGPAPEPPPPPAGAKDMDTQRGNRQ